MTVATDQELLARVLADLDRDGYAVVESLLSADEAAAVRTGLRAVLDATPIGRNDFEGFSTRRIYALFAKTRAFDALALHPLLLQVLDSVLGPSYQLSAPTGIEIGPGEKPQFLHTDDGIYPLPRPHPEVVLNSMWALDDFTEENGATRVVPGGCSRRGSASVVIPIHDDHPTRRTPVVTYALIALNFIFFFTEPVVSQIGVGQQTVAQVCQQQDFFDRYAAIPRELTTNKPLPPHQYEIRTDQGVQQCPVINESGKQPYLSVLYSMFLHGGWLHILGNMLFLYIFGNNVEDRFGRLKFLLFYLFCGYVAAYGFAYGNPDSTTTLVGASGAIAGVLGAYLVLFPRARVMSIVPIAILWIPIRLPAWLVLGGWFLLQWLYSSGSGVASGAGVAYLAHVYGFVAGVVVALLARPMLAAQRPRRPSYRY